MQVNLLGVILIGAGCALAGLLVGRNNPSLAAAAESMVKAGELKAQAFIAAAKAKLGVISK